MAYSLNSYTSVTWRESTLSGPSLPPTNNKNKNAQAFDLHTDTPQQEPTTTTTTNGLPLGPCGRQDFQLFYTAPILPLPIHPAPHNHSNPPSLLRGASARRGAEEEEEEDLPPPPVVGSYYGQAEGREWGGLVLLGELGKWVPFSPQRFADVRFSRLGHRALSLAVRGAPGERVGVGAAVWGGDGGEAAVVSMECVVGVDGRAGLWVWLVEGGETGAPTVAWACRSRVGEE